MLRRSSLLALLTVCACGASPQRLTAPGDATRPAVKLSCPRYVVGAQAALSEQAVMAIFGGQGTAEAPRFVADLVCQLGQRQPVVLALEWPRKAASPVNRFLGGSVAAASALRADPLWTAAPSAARGLATVAMWQLLEQLRAWRVAGLELTVVTFGENAPASPEEAEDGYGEGWERYQRQELLGALARKHPDAKVVLWIDPGQLEPVTSQRAASDDGEGSSGGRRRPAPDRLSFLEYAGTLAETAPRFVLEMPAEAATAAVTAAPTEAATAAVTAAPTEAATAASAVAPWSLERRAGLPGYDGVFRLGPTTTSPRFAAAAPDAAAPRPGK
ncbi:MAG: hypothetical protein IPI49_00795 [Myxococcales bacterium]|nr:hypothetical protein [Myxococcales bacterium]